MRYIQGFEGRSTRGSEEQVSEQGSARSGHGWRCGPNPGAVSGENANTGKFMRLLDRLQVTHEEESDK